MRLHLYFQFFHVVLPLLHQTLSHGILIFKFDSQLEGSLSQWTSYQEDVHQFVAWIERVEESLDPADKQCPEMRDKTANLSKAKALKSSTITTTTYCVLNIQFIVLTLCSNSLTSIFFQWIVNFGVSVTV